MRALSALVLSLLLAAQLGLAQTPAPLLQHLLKVTCDGTVEVAPSGPVGLGLHLPIFRNMFDAIMDAVKGRAQCACPQSTDDDFAQLFNPFVAMLNNVQETPAAPNQCLADAFPRNLAQFTMFRIDFPNTCSLAKWKADKRCTMKHAFPRIDAELQLAFSQCQGSHLPAMSLTCGGSGCANLGKVCKADGECGGKLTCFNFSEHFNLNVSHVADQIFEGLQSALIYDDVKDVSPGCYQSARGFGAPTPANDVLTNLLSFVAGQLWGSVGTFSELSFCGILEAANFTSEEFGQNQTALAGAEAELELIDGPHSCLLEETGGSSLESYFEQMSTEGTFSWKDAIFFHDQRCPGNSPSSSEDRCFNTPSWGSNDNNCRSSQLQQAFFGDSDWPCFPGCPFGASSTNEQDLRWFYDVLMQKWSENNPTMTFKDNWQGSVVSLGNQFQWSIPSGLHKNTLNVVLAALDRILDVIPLEANGTFSNENRLIYGDISSSSQLFLSNLHRPLASDPRCKLTWGKDELSQMLLEEFNAWVSLFNTDGDPTELSFEELNLARVTPSTGIAQVFWTVIQNLQNIPIDELTTRFIRIRDMVLTVVDADEDGLISIADILYANENLQGGFILFSTALSTEYWPEDEDRTTFGGLFPDFVAGQFDNATAETEYEGTVLTKGDPFFNNLYNHYWSQRIPLHAFYDVVWPKLLSEFSALDKDAGGSVSYEEALAASSGTLLWSTLSYLLSYQHFSSITVDDYLDEFSPFERLDADSRVFIKVPHLAPWDGIIAAPLSVFPIANVIPAPQPDPTKASLVKFTCEQKLILDMNNVGILVNTHLSKMANHLAGLLKNLVACRSTPPSTDSATFLTRYGMWAPLLWLHLIDDQAVSFPLPTEADWLSSLFGFDQDQNIRISNLPASCNFERVVKEGVCSFDFLGLSKLFLADITLRVTTKSCGAETLTFSYEVECIGADCPWFEGLSPCDTNAQCTPGMSCLSLPELITHIASQAIEEDDGQGSSGPSNGNGNGTSSGDSEDGGSSSGGFDSIGDIFTNQTAIERIALRTDFLELFLSNKYNNGTCSAPSFFGEEGESFLDLLGNSKDSQCFGPAKWADDLQRMIVRILGPRQVKYQAQSKLHFCMPDKEVFEIDEMETWATSLVEVDGNRVTLNSEFFRSVFPSQPTPTPNPGNNNGLPTCRCSKTCGSLGPACSACYQAGGMVLPSTPGACFCPSDRSTLSLSLLNNYLPSFGLLCKDPLPTCSNCTACHSSCATCFGPAYDQCLSCANPTNVLVVTSAANGALERGRCMASCPAGQYRNQEGNCQGPDCSALNNCTSAGTCFHSTFARVDRCLCNEGHFGADCSQAPDCSAYSNCNGQGTCVYNQHFRSGRCRCLPGFKGTDCSEAVVKATPSFATELGGSLISVSRGAGFEPADEVVCVFGSQEVDAIVLADKTAACAAPPSSSGRKTTQFGVKVNGGSVELADDAFIYTFSGELPPVSEAAATSQLFWPSGTTRTIALGAGLSSEACQGAVTVSVLPWSWNQFTSGQTSPALESPVTVASTSSAGSVQVTLSLGFSWDEALHVLSIAKGVCRQNSYVVPVASTPDFGAMCQAWLDQEEEQNWPELQDLFPCPPSLFAADVNYETYPTCSLERGVSHPSSNCYLNTGAAACRFSTFPFPGTGAGQLCCYNQKGELLSNRVTGGGHSTRFGVGPSREIRVVRQFVADLLPSLLCCRLSDNCEAFATERPSSSGRTWFPPRLGGGFGDPHFVTLDGKFWTFNGLGEYVLVERSDSHPFVLQGRFTQASAPNGTLTRATLMTAAAVKDGNSTISAYLDDLLDDVVFFDGETQVGTLTMGSSYQSSNGEVMIFASGGKYTVVLPSGVNLELKAEVSMLNVFALLPDSFKSKTRGLLGTWNGNKNDDFTPRTGAAIPATSTQEALFGFGQGYRTTPSDTLFVYPDGEDHADYNDLGFTPDFISPNFATVELRDQAQAACAGAPDADACMYDVAQTGDLRAANVALKSGAVFQSFASATNTPPEVTGPTQVSVKLGQNVEVSYTVTDAEEQEVTLGLLTAPTSTGTLDSAAKKYTFTVSTTMFLERSLSSLAVVGVDEGGSSSAPATTNFTLVYSTCDDELDGLVQEASLELTASCLGDECSDACAEALNRLLALTCRSDVIKQIGQLYTAGRDKCCTSHESIPCTDKFTGGLSQGAVIGIAVGASIGGLALIAAIGAAIYFSKKGSGSRDKLHSTEMAKM